ncbi:MAG TPA: aldehyde dehydrogenase family protein [Solirubrobacterales bacterium]|jgi:acyl-CoA reductase-like NAD-dependent aldehyde dehydrogenase|nr:aldehyde dehydrogenase family protein [Solirubrobacterales bacterium]
MSTQTVDAVDHKLLVAGEWVETGKWGEVESPYDGSPVGRVALGDAATVDRAAKAAREAFETADFPQHERAAVLDRAAELVGERVEDLALTISAEAGKPLKTATVEAQRCVDTLTFSATEARKLTGGTVPMEASASGAGKLGVMLRVPYGVVGAISPFNFPLNLVAHKLGPAIAAGNAVVLKPAGQTPISALKLAKILMEAGLPEGWLSVVPGPGSEVGNAIVEHELTAALSFTGSAKVGWDIRSRVPHKKVNLELGSNAPLIVHSDGDWEAAADKAQIHAFSHAGQSCISIQRILLHEDIADAFKQRLIAKMESLKVGNPFDSETDVGPLITPGDRDRVKQWIDEAVGAGAELLTGGELVDEGRCLAPTLIGSPPKDAKVWCEEIFGPVATVDTFSSFEQALAMANDSKFGLQAGVFTRDIGRGLEAGRTLEFGGVLINEVPTFRADQQPYGGVKDSGNTREGPAFAVLELTEERFVTLQG